LAKLSVYQTRAVEQLGQFGLTENIMLNWKPRARNEDFLLQPFAGITVFAVRPEAGTGGSCAGNQSIKRAGRSQL